jgi:hypothetical protein
LKRALILLFALLPASLAWLSCGAPTSGSAPTNTIKYRAFISNSVSAGTSAPGVYVVDAQNDVRGPGAPISAGNNPGMMVVTPNKAQTLVFSGNGLQDSDNVFTLINNAAQTTAAHMTLPGMTQSFVVSPDSSTAYVAVPTAPVTGQSPGIVQVISLSSGAVSGTIYCPPGNPTPAVCVSADPNLQGINPSYQYLAIGNTGARVLAFSSGSGTNFDSIPNVVAVITPSSLATANTLITFVPGFDHPVWAFFNSDDTTAYVVNCGPECGGIQASIQTLDLTTTPPTAGIAVPVPAATVAVVNNSTMYLAGTPMPAPACAGETTQATTCGVLTIFDLGSMSVIQPPVQPAYCAPGQQCPIIITDGYHDRMALGSNGQLFIGARTCTEIVAPIPAPPGAEVRGCLSIYNTLGTGTVGSNPPGGVVIPPANGDVTGLQPIVTRRVVYVIQGGSLNIYDATIDALEYNPNDPNNPGEIFGLVGDFYDVVTVDF